MQFASATHYPQGTRVGWFNDENVCWWLDTSAPATTAAALLVGVMFVNITNGLT